MHSFSIAKMRSPFEVPTNGLIYIGKSANLAQREFDAT
jgi:hypothetical protein